jgi:diaminopimelate epimerase
MVSIDMGAPRFGWDQVPLAYAIDTTDVPAGWGDLAHGMAINVGNPHIVFFVPDLDEVPLAELGPEIELDPLFPERVNVNVAEVTGPASLRLRVWERGSGLTQACGTGACATAVAAISRRLVQSPVTVSLPGGELSIAWTSGENIRMSGPATHVFSGEAELEAFG